MLTMWQILKLPQSSLAELARNSVIQSGFEMEIKRHWLGERWYLPGAAGNDIDKVRLFLYEQLCNIELGNLQDRPICRTFDFNTGIESLWMNLLWYGLTTLPEITNSTLEWSSSSCYGHRRMIDAGLQKITHLIHTGTPFCRKSQQNCWQFLYTLPGFTTCTRTSQVWITGVVHEASVSFIFTMSCAKIASPPIYVLLETSQWALWAMMRFSWRLNETRWRNFSKLGWM